MRPRDVHEAVDQLVQRQRIKVRVDDNGRNVWGTVPSLIEQLRAAVSRADSASDSGHRFGSRPPIAIGILELLADITKTAARGAGAGKHARESIEANLRKIAADHADRPRDDVEAALWVEKFDGFADRARAQLGTEPRYPKGLRGIRCPKCFTTHVLGQDDTGQTIRLPVLQFEWPRALEVTGNELPRLRTVKAVVCQNPDCAERWWAGAQFHLLQELIDEDKRLRDTATPGVA